MGRRVALLALVEHEPQLPYTAPLAMFFGAESALDNPFRLREAPDRDWARAHPAAVWDIVPGDHGLFVEPYLSTFADRLKERLAAAETDAQE